MATKAKNEVWEQFKNVEVPAWVIKVTQVDDPILKDLQKCIPQDEWVKFGLIYNAVKQGVSPKVPKKCSKVTENGTLIEYTNIRYSALSDKFMCTKTTTIKDCESTSREDYEVSIFKLEECENIEY